MPKNAKHSKNRPRKSDTDEGKGRNVNHVRMKSVFDRGVDVYRAWKTSSRYYVRVTYDVTVKYIVHLYRTCESEEAKSEQTRVCIPSLERVCERRKTA